MSGLKKGHGEMMIKQIGLRQLVESASRDVRPTIGDINCSKERGFHVYGELRLSLKMTAAEDTRDAQRYLSILQDYATIADACARETQAELLEVQGERIHLLMPCAAADRTAVDKVIAFAISFAQLVYTKIGAKAGKEFQGFALATDHGDALILLSGSGADGSIISLGPAANAPAKRLGTEKDGRVKTPARHLAMRSEILRAIQYPSDSSEWTNIDLSHVAKVFEGLMDGRLTERLSRASEASLLLEKRRGPPEVNFVQSGYFAERDFTPGQALKLSAFCMRADLDGFTKEVQEAFKTGNTEALVLKFVSIIEFAKQFSGSRDRKIIQLPWAGDCANLIVLPKYAGESYEAAQMYVPAQLPAEWHSQVTGSDREKRPWAHILGKTRWAVGCAGGEVFNGSRPVILLATVHTAKRDFMVAAGWAPGRSLDALDAEGVRGTDTVIPEEDYQAIDSQFQDLFEELDSRFRISRGLTKEKVRDATVQASAQQTGPYVVPVGRHTPPAKPHWWCNDSSHTFRKHRA
ncbi:MAG: hypothetical protein KA248_00480 [Kiritimatiellae bacterium]|nr:hypothetical protein [Kiritimatiellia bacterium]